MNGTNGSTTKTMLWSGRVLSGLVTAFLLADGGAKLVQPAAVVEGTVQLGYPVEVITGLGLVLLASTILYAIPRTAILGAILLTGYLGGAVATHVRVLGPAFNVFFSVAFGVVAWGGLWLRDEALRALIPVRR